MPARGFSGQCQQLPECGVAAAGCTGTAGMEQESGAAPCPTDPFSLSSLCRASATTECLGLAPVLPGAEGHREGAGDPESCWLRGDAERDSPCFPTCCLRPRTPTVPTRHIHVLWRGCRRAGMDHPALLPALHSLATGSPSAGICWIPEGSRLNSSGMGTSCSQPPHPILTLHILWGTSVRPPGATNSIPPSQM